MKLFYYCPIKIQNYPIDFAKDNRIVYNTLEKLDHYLS